MLRKPIPEVALLIICVFVCLVFVAKAVKTTPTANLPSQTVAATPAPDASAIVRAELAAVKDYDQRLLSTVYWSLSGVFLLVVLIGGVNWFTNYRLYERERDSLRQTLKLDAQEEAIKLRSLVEQLQSQLRGEAEQLRKRVVAFETNMNELLSEREKRLKGVMEASVKSAKEDLEHEVANAELANSETRAAFYSAANDPWEVLRAWLDNLQALEKLDWLDEHFMGKPLNAIEACLQKDFAVGYQTHTELKRILQRGPEVLAARTARILDRLDNMRHV
jgi:hypothetical protein